MKDCRDERTVVERADDCEADDGWKIWVSVSHEEDEVGEVLVGVGARGRRYSERRYSESRYSERRYSERRELERRELEREEGVMGREREERRTHMSRRWRR